MEVSYLRPLTKTEAPQKPTANLLKIDRLVVTLICVSVTFFYFFAIGFWSVVGPYIRMGIHHGIGLNN